LVDAFLSRDRAHEMRVRKAFQSSGSRLSPEWTLQDWVYNKTAFMKQCIKAGIPTIDTIFVTDGFDPESVLKQVQAKGWDSFFIKPAYLSSFSLGTFHAKTKDCIKDSSLLATYESEVVKHYGHDSFLVQPYTLKPNGDVFDELRHFFIDGEWAYCIQAVGQAGGPRGMMMDIKPDAIEKSKVIARKAYLELLRLSKWRGKPSVPPLVRVDIGLVPDSTRSPKKYRIFLNEFETEAGNMFTRMCPFNLLNCLADVYAQKVCELLSGLRAAGETVPNAKSVWKLLPILEQRLEAQRGGAAPAKRRRLSADGGS